jgi:UDP-N-acetylglucosamine 2-epimerase
LSRLKVMPIVGVRPQVIKAAPLIKLLNEHDKVQLQLLHTGQHYDFEMSRVFFRDFDLPKPLVNLGVRGGTHAEQTADMMVGIEKAVLRHKPDVVLVFGDANTALAGALAAVKIHTPVAHVESGLRSGNMKMPEEVNRILVDHCSDILFAPTKLAVQNLRRENISPRRIFNVGDTMVDAMHHWKQAIESSSILNRLSLEPESYIVLTAHRAENVDNKKRLDAILSAIVKIGELTVFPVHPRTRKRLHQFGLWNRLVRSRNVLSVDALDYMDMLCLMKNSKLVLTDSGGIQKEAFLLQVPCLTLRDETEWTETVSLKANRLVGACQDAIIRETRKALDRNAKQKLSGLKSPFGDGRASERILAVLLRQFQ